MVSDWLAPLPDREYIEYGSQVFPEAILPPMAGQ